MAIYMTPLTDKQLLDRITRLRTKNNLNWMAILRIALKYAPKETREILADIREMDSQVSLRTYQLVMKDEDSKPGN